MFKFTCPNCHFETNLDDRFAGRKGKCPGCGQVVEVTKPRVEGIISDFVDAESEFDTPTIIESNLLAVPVAGILTTLLYLLIHYSARTSYIGILLMDRGPTQHATMFVFFWASYIMIMKFLRLRRDLTSLRRVTEVLPLSLGIQINYANVDGFLTHLRNLPAELKRGRLIGRIYGALQHFKARPRAQEVYDYMSSQAAIDADKLNASHSLLRTMVWAMPILGFIGTVLGIGIAVTALSGTLGGSAGDSSAIVRSLQAVTSGLATAFDTTLLALVLSVIVMFPLQALRRQEDALLSRIEEFGNEELIRRLGDQTEINAADPAEALARFDQAMYRAATKIREELEGVGKAIGDQIGERLEPLTTRLGEAQQQFMQLEDHLKQMLASVRQEAEQVGQAVAKALDSEQSRVTEMKSAYEELAGVRADHARQARELAERLGDAAEHYSRLKNDGMLVDPRTFTADLVRDVSTQFSASIDRLASRMDGPLTLPAAPPKRRGFLARFRRR